jgi:hypothetical protein
MQLRARRSISTCPACGAASRRVHNHYQRKLADLHGKVCRWSLLLQSRKFFCVGDSCRRKIFTEPLFGTVARYARRSCRSSEALHWLTIALSGPGRLWQLWNCRFEVRRCTDAAGLAETLRDVSLEYLRDGSETERLRSIGLLLGPDVQELLRCCEEHVALASGNYLRLLAPVLPPFAASVASSVGESTAQRHVAGSQCD